MAEIQPIGTLKLTSNGIFPVSVCGSCGALIITTATKIHKEFHEGLLRTADDAGWGAMLRPLK